MSPPNRANAAMRWSVRIVPAFITCIFIFATYTIVGHICVGYLLRRENTSGIAAGLITLYFVLFLLMMAAYARLFISIQRDPGLVPLINGSKNDEKHATRSSDMIQTGNGTADSDWKPPDTNPDSPGLEMFYSKDVFVCEVDGRPKWCSTCQQWKPDRARHSSDLGRCVHKMDHLCPWVGGMVAERSFNFFAQFTFYCSLYCAICLAVGIYTILLQQEEEILDGWVIAIVAISAFFLLFAGGMTLTSLRYILTNITNIDMMRRSQTHYLAVHIPRNTPPSSAYTTITYPLAYPSYLPNGQPTWSGPIPPSQPAQVSERDRLAERRFAILHTKARENPWDLGYGANWRSVMGERVIDWLLPLRHSPCCNHESQFSDYRLGPLLNELKERYGLPVDDQDQPGDAVEGGIELQGGVIPQP